MTEIAPPVPLKGEPRSLHSLFCSISHRYIDMYSLSTIVIIEKNKETFELSAPFRGTGGFTSLTIL
jgi:hypothetical protein